MLMMKTPSILFFSIFVVVFFCLRLVSYVPKVANVSWLSILDCFIGFLYRLFTWHEYCSLQQKIQKDKQ